MNNPEPTSSSSDAVTITGALTIDTVEKWRVSLAAAFETAPQIAIDLAAVEPLDVFGLQLLWSVRRTAQARGKPFRLINAAAALERACLRAGFASDSLSSPDFS